MKIKFYLLLCLTCSTVLHLYSQCPRATMVEKYNTLYLTSATPNVGWTGNSAGCVAGTVSDSTQIKTLQRINYFRDLVGLPANITFDTTKNRKCQEAALMMTANSALSHYPPTSWNCYTADGAEAAGKSNIGLGMAAGSAINGYMNDNGTGNTAVGHRRWILYSKALVFGHGNTSNADALWVIGGSGPSATISYVAYPSEGFFPAPLVPSSTRWSFSKPAADFSQAKVNMTDPAGNPVTVTLEPLANGYGDNTLVWKASGIVTNNPIDQPYTVTLDSVIVSGAPTTYTYTVIIAQTVHPPQCPQGETWSETDCACKPAVHINPAALQFSELSVQPNPFQSGFRLDFSCAQTGSISFSLLDINGRLVTEQTADYQQAGEKAVLEFETQQIATGIYWLQAVHSEGGLQTVKVVKQD